MKKNVRYICTRNGLHSRTLSMSVRQNIIVLLVDTAYKRGGNYTHELIWTKRILGKLLPGNIYLYIWLNIYSDTYILVNLGSYLHRMRENCELTNKTIIR